MNRRFWILYLIEFGLYIGGVVILGVNIVAVVNEVQAGVAVVPALQGITSALLLFVALLAGGQLIRVLLKIEDHLYMLRYEELEESSEPESSLPPLEVGMITSRKSATSSDRGVSPGDQR